MSLQLKIDSLQRTYSLLLKGPPNSEIEKKVTELKAVHLALSSQESLPETKRKFKLLLCDTALTGIEKYYSLIVLHVDKFEYLFGADLSHAQSLTSHYLRFLKMFIQNWKQLVDDNLSVSERKRFLDDAEVLDRQMMSLNATLERLWIKSDVNEMQLLEEELDERIRIQAFWDENLASLILMSNINGVMNSIEDAQDSLNKTKDEITNIKLRMRACRLGSFSTVMKEDGALTNGTELIDAMRIELRKLIRLT